MCQLCEKSCETREIFYHVKSALKRNTPAVSFRRCEKLLEIFCQFHMLLHRYALPCGTKFFAGSNFCDFNGFHFPTIRKKKVPAKILLAKLYSTIQTSQVESCCCHLFKTSLSFRNKTMQWETKGSEIKQTLIVTLITGLLCFTSSRVANDVVIF